MGHLFAGDFARLIFSSRPGIARADHLATTENAAPAASLTGEARHAR
jgi:hypothetical protein